MPELDCSRIIDALSRLRAAQTPIFGADDHGFQLNRTQSEADVVAFERKYGISLPRDYRKFLTCVGNGGAGPFYGIFPLGKVDDNFDLRSWQEDDGLVGTLSIPFPLEQEWNDLSLMPADDLFNHDEAQYNEQIEEFEKMYYSSSLVNGSIPICHEGCALRVWLVVTGTQAGNLWEDKRAENGGIKPLRLADGSLATFASWYDDWLNGCLNVST